MIPYITPFNVYLKHTNNFYWWHIGLTILFDKKNILKKTIVLIRKMFDKSLKCDKIK